MKSRNEKADRINDLEKFRKLVRSISAEAFDGHTEFSCLNPEQRFMWLSQGARFISSPTAKRNCKVCVK